MIKTIDTNEITEEMLYAGVYAAERCADAGIIDLKDVVYEAIFSALEVAPAVEPAQAVEPLDAPHPDYAEYITFEGSTRIVISPDDYEQLYNAATRRAPPAIDAETKRMVLEQTK